MSRRVPAARQRARPLDPARDEPMPHFAPVGTRGIRQYGGYLHEESLAALRGVRGTRTFREMGLDPVVSASLKVIKLLIRQTPTDVEPLDAGDPDARVAADFVESCLGDLESPWTRVLERALSMLQYNWAALEVVHRVRDGSPGTQHRDGLIGWRDFELRPQDSLERWQFDPAGQRVEAMIQQDPTSGKTFTVPIGRLLLFRPFAHKDDPEGEGILRGAYDAWYYKTNVRRFEAIGIERDVAGLPVGRIPGQHLLAGSPTAGVADQWEHLVTQVRANRHGSILIPSDRDQAGNRQYELDLLQSAGQKMYDVHAVIQRYTTEIALALLTDVLLVGHEKVGSFSLHSSKTSLLATAIAAYYDEILDVFNRHAIPQLLRLNPSIPQKPPRLVHGDLEVMDLNEAAVYIGALTTAGVDLTDPPTQDRLRRLLHLPEAPVPALPERTEPAEPRGPRDGADDDDREDRVTEPTTTTALQLTPSDVASIVTVDEARRSVGLAPLGGEDGRLTIAEFQAKIEAELEAKPPEPPPPETP